MLIGVPFGSCCGGLLVRPTGISEDDGVIELGVETLDYPEKILAQAVISGSSVETCMNWSGGEDLNRGEGKCFTISS